MTRAALIAALAACALPAAAQDLLQVYRDAQKYDAVYSAARFTLEAGREKLPQARAGLLPQLDATGTATRSRIESDSRASSPANPGTLIYPNSSGYNLTLTQPLYRPAAAVAYDQAEFQVRQAEATFGQASQDLAVRVAQAYFDVLTAQDSLELVGAQKAAISEQLAQAKRNFEVGTATITDTHEAQARYDLVVAQEIAANSELDNRRRSLQAITGKEYERLTPLRSDVRLSPPNPAGMQSWVDLAEKQSYPVQVQQAATEVAQREMRRTADGHWPTLDLVGRHGQNRDSGSVTSPVGRDSNTASISLELKLPLFAGGSVSSREREAEALYNKARDDLLSARRTAALDAQRNYLSVVNGIAQVGALEQALISSQSALDSNRLGYEVGVRINIDVLNAQQQLFQTRRDLATARYNTITSHLRLKAAAGSLRDEDIEEVNRALAP